MDDLPNAYIDGTTALADWVIILPVVLPLIGAALLVMLRSGRDLHWLFAGVIVFAVLACDFELVRRTIADGPFAMTMGRWLPPFGITFAADAMGATFALAAAVVTLVVLVYAQTERHSPDGRDGFFPMVLVLLAGVSGAFLTGDLFNLYVWFEVMLISSFGLMVLGGRPIQLDATVKYGFINFLATTFFLIALGLLYGLLGTLNMADVARTAPAANPAALASIAALLLLAFGIKAAAFPVNAWLPASYHAPPVTISALMAGLMTKVGVYALLRTLVGVLPEAREMLEPVLLAVVVGTLVIAPLGAIAETNLRRAIGFLVIGGIGAAGVGLVVPTADGVAGSVIYAVQAMLTMTALYLVAGVIETVTGETDTRRMGGLYARTTITAILFLVLILAVSGVPPFLGFWPKLVLLQATLDSGAAAAGPELDWAGIVTAGAVLVNAFLTLIAGSRLWSHIFLRPHPDNVSSRAVDELAGSALYLRLVAAGAITALIAVLGLWPQPLIDAGSAAAVDLIDLGRYTSAVGLGVLE